MKRMIGCLALALLAGCGVDGVPNHPDGTPATAIDADRNVTISGSAAFGVTSGKSPPSSWR